MARYTVVLDACVLYPAPLRDLLLQLAGSGLFRARWTDQIHQEWSGNLLGNRPDLDPRLIARTIELMNAAVPDCLVTGYDDLIPTIDLPDPDDRHVVAAAIAARADAVVTYNLKDFPLEKLAGFAIEAIHPDDFIMYQADLDDAAVVIAAQKCRGRLQNPVVSAPAYLERLRAMELPKTATWLQQFGGVI